MAIYNNEYEDSINGGSEAMDEYFEETATRAGRKLISRTVFEDDEEDDDSLQTLSEDVFSEYEED